MSTTATHVDEQLLDYAYGELSDRDASAVKSHLATCAQCQGALEDIQGVRKVMAKLPATDAPKDGLDSLLAYAEQAARRVQAGPAPTKAWWKAWVFPLAGVAAAAAFFVVAKDTYTTHPLDQAMSQAAMERASSDVQLKREETAANLAAAPAPAQEKTVAATPTTPAAAAPDGNEQRVVAAAPAEAKQVLAPDRTYRSHAPADEAPERQDKSKFKDSAAVDDVLAEKKPVAAAKADASPKADAFGGEGDAAGKTFAKNGLAHSAGGDGVEGGLGGLGSSSGGGAGVAQGSLGGGTFGVRGAGPGGGGKGSVTVDMPAAEPQKKSNDKSEEKKAEKKKATAVEFDALAASSADRDERAKEPRRENKSEPPPPAPAKVATTTKAASNAAPGPSATGRAEQPAPAMIPRGSTSTAAAAQSELDDSSDLERAQTGSVAAAEPMPVMVAKEESEAPATRSSAAEGQKSDDARARGVLDQALAANRQHRYDDAIALSRQVLALRVSDERITQGALSALCEAQGAVADDFSACDRLVREYPSSGAAKLAKKKKIEFANRKAAKAADENATTATPAAAPPAAKARASEKAAPADADSAKTSY